MSVVRTTAKELDQLAEKYLSERTTEPKCVHRTLLLRSLVILKKLYPETEDFFAPMMKTLMPYAKRPDRKGDYENGMGRHYYCALSLSGKEMKMVNSYYRNGVKKHTKSARTMFEEDYTMALTMQHAGYMDQCGRFLGRAVHMISDMCCLPHTASMTYYSLGRSFHKGYERLAKAIYPDLVPEQTPEELPKLFESRATFADDLNKIALETAGGLTAVEADPVEAVKEHLLRTERVICAFLLRFYEDLTAKEREAHYILNGSGCRLLKGTDVMTIKITEKGLILHGVNPSPESKVNVTDMVFYAAHRHDGLFTLSPAKDQEGRVLEVKDGKLRLKKFDPLHGEQLFRL
ncbi:MAG: hypothetical protein J6U16_07325 [Ruminococcus sp.]|nr:hypothetical protein [Ruminococcus sp.]